VDLECALAEGGRISGCRDIVLFGVSVALGCTEEKNNVRADMPTKNKPTLNKDHRYIDLLSSLYMVD